MPIVGKGHFVKAIADVGVIVNFAAVFHASLCEREEKCKGGDKRETHCGFRMVFCENYVISLGSYEFRTILEGCNSLKLDRMAVRFLYHS